MPSRQISDWHNSGQCNHIFYFLNLRKWKAYDVNLSVILHLLCNFLHTESTVLIKGSFIYGWSVWLLQLQLLPPKYATNKYNNSMQKFYSVFPGTVLRKLYCLPFPSQQQPPQKTFWRCFWNMLVFNRLLCWMFYRCGYEGCLCCCLWWVLSIFWGKN